MDQVRQAYASVAELYIELFGTSQQQVHADDCAARVCFVVAMPPVYPIPWRLIPETNKGVGFRHHVRAGTGRLGADQRPTARSSCALVIDDRPLIFFRFASSYSSSRVRPPAPE